MELYVTLLYVMSILALVDSSQGDHTNVDCSFAEGKRGTDLHDMLVDSVSKCFVKVGNLDLQTLEGTDDIHVVATFFKEYCQNHQLIDDCLSTISSHYSVCVNDTQDIAVTFLEDILRTALSYGCVGGGRHLSNVMFMALNIVNTTLAQNEVTDCVGIAMSTGREGNTLDTARLLRFYREIKVFKQCLVNGMRGREDNEAVFGVDLMLNGITRNIKCPHPEDGTLTLCSTLDADPSTDEKVCLFQGEDEDDPPTFKTVFNLAAECTMVNLNHLDFENLKTFTKIEDYQSFFDTYCKNKPHILNCLSDASSSSKVCQNQTNHQVFELYKDFFEYSLETGCKQDGVNLSAIVSGIYNREVQAIGNDTMRECKRAAEVLFKSHTNLSDTLSSMVFKVYRSGVAFKQCILDGASEVGSFKSLFGNFMNAILRAAKCVSSDDRTVVLCETLIEN